MPLTTVVVAVTVAAAPTEILVDAGVVVIEVKPFAADAKCGKAKTAAMAMAA